LGASDVGFLGFLGAPRGLPLTACVFGCHVTTSVSPNAIVTAGHPAQSRLAKSVRTRDQPPTPARPQLDLAHSWPVSAATSSAAVRQRSSSSPTCALVPRSGSS